MHAYLQTVGSGEFERADALWAPRRSPGAGEESGLRMLGPLRSLRIDNDTLSVLNAGPVPESVEVPVRLVAHVASSEALRFHGHYRVRRDPVRTRWEITGVSLRPVIR